MRSKVFLFKRVIIITLCVLLLFFVGLRVLWKPILNLIREILIPAATFNFLSFKKTATKSRTWGNANGIRLQGTNRTVWYQDTDVGRKYDNTTATNASYKKECDYTECDEEIDEELFQTGRVLLAVSSLFGFIRSQFCIRINWVIVFA